MNMKIGLKLIITVVAFLMMSGCGKSAQTGAGNNGADKAEVGAEVAQAQRPNREEYTFKTTFGRDESGDYIDSIHVEGWARGQLTDFSYGHRLWVAQLPSKEDWLKEEDINFDGIPDLMIFRGYVGYGGQGGDVFEAYVWDAEQRAFVYVEKFNSLPDPTFNAEEKIIKVDYRESLADVIHGIYTVRGHKLEELFFDTEQFSEPED